MRQIARVFPRRTRATPRDCLAFIGDPPMFLPRIDAVEVSVTFSWDIPEAERLARAWSTVAPVSCGGPALGTRGEGFSPGRFLAPGYVITSRGCPNQCWFCSVWRRDGNIRELEIPNGFDLLDDNLLACSEDHIRSVFAMLARQPQPARFTGGLEAARLRDWHVDLLAAARPEAMFFACDSPEEIEPLISAGRLLRSAGFRGRGARPHRAMRCYVLVGHPRDSMTAAEQRLRGVARGGFIPMAMLWRSPRIHEISADWRRFQRAWARPALMARLLADDWRQVTGVNPHNGRRTAQTELFRGTRPPVMRS